MKVGGKLSRSQTELVALEIPEREPSAGQSHSHVVMGASAGFQELH